MLRKYELDPSHILEFELLEPREDISYMEQPIWVFNRKEQVLRTKMIPLVKIVWNHHLEEEATWEREEEMRECYPHYFQRLRYGGELRTKFL